MRILLKILLLASLLRFEAWAQNNDVTSVRTRAELSDYRETTRYDEVMAFLRSVVNFSDRMQLTSFGYTTEGRSLPLVVFGDVTEATPEAVLDSRKTRIYLQGNIHAGEVCGKEALLMLLRDLASGKHSQWKNSLVLLIAPIYNADGNERISLYNRPRQHGPVGGMGQRPNAQGYDLNRDHMKLDSPEARSLVTLMDRYDPHVAIDLHTTNGTRHAYHLTYSPPLNPNTDNRIDSFLREKWLPEVTRQIKNKHGWDYYYYGNLPWRGMNAERGWYTFDHRPRFNNNYVGLRNRFAILSEAYSYATFEERVAATLYFVGEILNFAHANAPRIAQITAEADQRSVVGQRFALSAHHVRSSNPVEILLGNVEEERNPSSGKTMLRRTEARKPESMYEYGRFEASETVVAPVAYFVPADLDQVIDLLSAHGVRFDAVAADLELTFERFRIDSVQVADQEYQGHKQQTLFGSYESSDETIAAGTLRVPVNQPLGKLVVYLLEPRSDDGLVSWGLLNETLKNAEHYPILRRAAAR